MPQTRKSSGLVTRVLNVTNSRTRFIIEQEGITKLDGEFPMRLDPSVIQGQSVEITAEETPLEGFYKKQVTHRLRIITGPYKELVYETKIQQY